MATMDVKLHYPQILKLKKEIEEGA